MLLPYFKKCFAELMRPYRGIRKRPLQHCFVPTQLWNSPDGFPQRKATR